MDRVNHARAHEVVSFESEELILVDENDNPTGVSSKADCHDGDGELHRAFSVFVFNGKGELLLQQRSADKRLWPLFWSNSCCSHPRNGESMDVAVFRRLEQELGIRCELEFVYKFKYHARYGSEGSEREYCWVYVGTTEDPVRANDTEVAEWRFVKPEALDDELERQPDRFTPWMKMEWARLRSEYVSALDAAITGETAGRAG